MFVSSFPFHFSFFLFTFHSGSSLCVYSTPLSFATTCPFPTSFHLVVSKPSTPTGPRAWMRLVLIPTSAPRPKRKPSAKRVEALEKTQAESTELTNSAMWESSSERMASVWPLPCAWMWETAAVVFCFFGKRETSTRSEFCFFLSRSLARFLSFFPFL